MVISVSYGLNVAKIVCTDLCCLFIALGRRWRAPKQPDIREEVSKARPASLIEVFTSTLSDLTQAEPASSGYAKKTAKAYRLCFSFETSKI